jgi:DNA-binding GntR family transcriptional regulator
MPKSPVRDTAKPAGLDVVSVESVDISAYDFTTADSPERSNLNSWVYAMLREALISGAFPPGSMLTIRPVAQQLKVSTMPIREALMMLKAEGALELAPNRGFRVPIISGDTFRESLLIRLSLECALAERAAAKATSSDVRLVSEAYERMTAAEDGPIENYLRLHRRFHRSIYRIADMPLVQETIESIWVRVGPLLLASTRGRLINDRTHHYAILEALRAGDVRGIAERLRNDILDSIHIVLDYLEGLKTDETTKSPE